MQSQELSHLHVITSHGEHVLSNQDHDKSFLEPNNHIEADTHLFLHLADAVRSGHSKAFMRTVDSDIVVLATALFKRLVHLGLTHLWIGFGKGKNYRDIPIHEICSRMSDEETRALLLFHALSGCDTVSQPMGIGKKTAWDRWKSMPELTQSFISLLENPEKYSKDTPEFQVLQRYMILQYAKTSSANNLNEARLQLFSCGKKTLETLPPKR